MSEINRRDALRFAAGAAILGACKRTSSAFPESETPMKPAIISTEKLAFPWQTSDPFLFCVYHLDHYPKGNTELGPQASLQGRRLGSDFARKDGWNMYHGQVVPGFPKHPHRGFETVTIVRRGLVDHSDSLGATARYGGGDAQWLTTGAGIQHSEMFPLLQQEQDNPLELFQIWLNLPSQSKMVSPYFEMFWSEDIPLHVFKDDQGKESVVSTIAGVFPESTAPPAPPPDSWASQPGADVAIWTLKLEPGAKLSLPESNIGVNRDLYFFAGDSLSINGQPAPIDHHIRVEPTVPLLLENGQLDAELLMLQGRPIGEPVAQHGPFVMNSRQELAEAFQDYQRTQFGGWPWQKPDPVHEREDGRFALHPDGKIDKPKSS